MRLSTMLDYSGDIKQVADSVADLERAGLDVVWVAEAYGCDSPSQMGYIAAKTERIEIGSAILPVYSRTPALLAQTAVGIDTLSQGRFILGLGTSGPQVIEGWHAVPFNRPLDSTREIIDICRKVWRREVLTNEGIHTIPLPTDRGTGFGRPLRLLNRPVRDSIPIWVASMGPKNVAMTAEVADGWFPFIYVPENAGEVWGDSLAQGRARRDPSLPPLEIAAGGLAAVGEGLEPLRNQARSMLALYIGGMGPKGANFYNTLVSRFGYEAQAGTIQDLYLSGKREEAMAAVPDDLVERSTLVGPPAYVKERIAAYKETGVTVLNVTAIGPDRLETIEKLKELIA